MSRRKPPLITPEFAGRLHALREIAFTRLKKRETRGGGTGQTPEFDSHRSYEPGDEPRYIDWNVYARMEKLLLKMYVSDEETQVSILVDTSHSMRSPYPAKALVAARSAAAFAYLALCAKKTVALGAFAGRLLASAGPLRSLGRFPRCLDFLSRLPEGMETGLGAGITQFLAGYRSHSILLLISDFMQDEDVGRRLDMVLNRKIRAHVVHVLDDAEMEPALKGELTAEDVETPETINLSVGDDILDAYRDLIREHMNGIGEACRARAVPYLQARTSRDLEETIIGHLTGREGRTVHGPQ